MDHIAHWKMLIIPDRCSDKQSYERFVARVDEGRLTREENPETHVSAYFLPINRDTQQVFLVHHKKSGLWISPGGHLELGETPEQAVNREIQEELGVPSFFTEPPSPFFLSIVDIDRPQQTCKTHFDAWYAMETDGHDFNIDPVEFHATAWLTIPEAREIVTDPSNLEALRRIEQSW